MLLIIAASPWRAFVWRAFVRAPRETTRPARRAYTIMSAKTTPVEAYE
jgi:hypothetical protein